MKPAAEKLALELQNITFNAPTIPVVNNVDVKCETAPDAIRDALVRQLYSPFSGPKPLSLWLLRASRICMRLAGKVLTGLTKRIVDTLTASALNEPAAMSAALEQ